MHRMRPSKKSYELDLLLIRKREERTIAPCNAHANKGGKQGEKQQVQIQGALTPGSITFKRVGVASVRSKIAALEEASNTSSLTNDTKNINADKLVSAIMSLSADQQPLTDTRSEERRVC